MSKVDRLRSLFGTTRARMLVVAVLGLITFHGLGAGEEGAESPSPRQEAAARGWRLIRSPKPPYPAEALKKGIQGRVTVRLSVKDGQIITATGIGPEPLADFSAQWVKEHWLFPKDITGTFTLPIVFTHPKSSATPAASALPPASPTASVLPSASPAASALPSASPTASGFKSN